MVFGLGEVLGEPRGRRPLASAKRLEVRVEVPTVDGDELLGLQRPLVGGKRQVGDGDGVV